MAKYKTGAPFGNNNNPNWKGGPATSPEYQCTFIKKDGTRCRKWRIKGTDRCNTKRHQRRGYEYNVGVKHLPRLYARAMTKTLRERVDDQLAATHDQQIELYEELALMRESATESVRMYALVAERIDEIRERGEEVPAKLAQARDHSAALMAEHLEKVKEYALGIARVRSLTKEKLTSHALYGVVHQVARMMYEVCGEEHEDIARRLESRMRQEITLPGDAESEGTNITPDVDVLEMDELVPRGPDGAD